MAEPTEGFLAIFRHRENPGDKVLSAIRVFIPVKEKMYAEVIASIIKERLDLKITSIVFKKARVTIIASRRRGRAPKTTTQT